jgi:ketosteroid isomerase-like protein
MSRAENRAILQKYYAALSGGDVEAVRALVHPDIRAWLSQTLAEHHGVQLPIEGFDRLAPMVEVAARRFGDVTVDYKYIVADHVMPPRRPPRGEYTNRLALLMRIDDGRISEVWEQPDSAHSLREFGVT